MAKWDLEEKARANFAKNYTCKNNVNKDVAGNTTFWQYLKSYGNIVFYCYIKQ